MNRSFGGKKRAEADGSSFFWPSGSDQWIRMDGVGSLAPASFFLADLPLVRMRFLPIGYRGIFVIVHLIIHAGAVLQHHVFLCTFILVVLDAFVDPLGIIGRLRESRYGYHHGDYDCG